MQDDPETGMYPAQDDPEYGTGREGRECGGMQMSTRNAESLKRGRSKSF
jgi:hypothetical protein